MTKKRIVFLEILFGPLFNRIASQVKQICNGYKTDMLRIDQLLIIKYFLTSGDPKKNQKGLSGNYLYNTTNLYSGILQNKISMKQPGVENTPKEIQSIHPSHFKRICPISISSQSPGNVISIIPDTPLDWCGRFL